ncbi:transposable element Tcb1 transposase [Trichonephila clavipes]|nr:transposable element Tcb1 transposase [Trichonephila clavipes]
MTVTDHSVTSEAVTHHIEYVTQHSESVHTIRRRLQQSLSARRLLLGLLLTHRQWYDERRMSGLARAMFQQDNARQHVARIVQSLFVNHQIELLPWTARSPDHSPIENMWPMVAKQLTLITPPAAIPDQLWQRGEATWSAVLQEHIQSLFESMPRRVVVVISNNGG